MFRQTVMRALFDTGKDGVFLRVQVQPGAGREGVVGVHGDSLKIQVVAPPVSDRANAAVVSLLARALGVTAESITITSGLHGRRKRVMFKGADPEEFSRLLELAVRNAEPERFGRRR
jgi:uncharacterized protein (TIGR00251 family)